jgi:hypothetical protein
MFIENVGQFADGARFQVWGGEHTVWLAEDAIWITVLEGPHPQSPAEQMAPFVASDDLSSLSRDKGDAARGRFAALSRLGERGHEPPGFLARRREDAEPRRGVNLRLSFPGANPHPRLEPFNRLETRISYFIGNDPEEWHPDVPVWGGVRYVDLYPGVDLEVHSENGQIVQRVVADGAADLSAVRLRVEGAEEVAVASQRLRLHTAVGELTLPLLTVEGAPPGAGPTAFHPAPGTCELQSPFASASAAPDRSTQAGNRSDLAYATFLGGSGGEYGEAIAVDESGAAYVAGDTGSSDFPITPGAFDTTPDGADAFVAKLDPAGSALAYATFLGGSEWDVGCAIAVDASGAACVVGRTRSPDFPTTPAAFDTTYHGGYLGDAFVARLNPEGSGLAYATFLGGSDDEEGWAVAVDASGAAYVAGETESSDFPTTPTAFDTTYNGGYWGDAFVAKLNPEGSALAYATFLGGSGWDCGNAIAVDASGAACVAGLTDSPDFPTTPAAFDTTLNGYHDTFVARLDPDGSALAYATFLGGSGSDDGCGVAVDALGAVYVAGWTGSPDFPATPAAFDTTFNGRTDAFVARLDPAGSELAYATFLGGSDEDYGVTLAVNASGAAYIAGETRSSDFPTTPTAFDTTFNGGLDDAFVAKLNATGSGLIYATFLGGFDQDDGHAIAVDASGAAYVAGWTESPDFPTTPASFDTALSGSMDAFVAKLVTNGLPTLGTITPSDGSGPAGFTAYFTTTWSDVDGWQDLEQCYFHVGASASIAGSVTLLYNAAKDRLWLRSDDGSQWTGGYAPGSSNVLQNSQAIVHCEQTTVQGAGDTLSVTWAIEFKPAFAGTKKLGLMARDTFGAKAKGTWKGTWTVIQGDLSITHLRYWGRDEYVQITNQGAGAQETSGWRIQSVRGDQWYSFPAGYSLAAGGHVRVRSGPDAWSSFPTDLKWTREYRWNDRGDEARLYDAYGSLVDSWGY